MTYNPGIPNANDVLSVSQGEIKTNFTQLDSQFGVDHIPFKNVSVNGTGFHKKVTFSNVYAGPGTDPDRTAPITSLYTKLVSGTPQLFFQNGAAGTDVIQITSGAGGAGFTSYVPVFTGYTLSLPTVTGFFSVINGMTFFSVDLTYSNATVIPTDLQVTLPTTSTSTGGQATYVDNNSQQVQIGVINSGNGFVLFQSFQMPLTATPKKIRINGFYI